jgi:hypothetical protein
MTGNIGQGLFPNRCYGGGDCCLDHDPPLGFRAPEITRVNCDVLYLLSRCQMNMAIEDRRKRFSTADLSKNVIATDICLGEFNTIIIAEPVFRM